MGNQKKNERTYLYRQIRKYNSDPNHRSQIPDLRSHHPTLTKVLCVGVGVWSLEKSSALFILYLAEINESTNTFFTHTAQGRAVVQIIPRSTSTFEANPVPSFSFEVIEIQLLTVTSTQAIVLRCYNEQHKLLPLRIPSLSRLQTSVLILFNPSIIDGIDAR